MITKVDVRLINDHDALELTEQPLHILEPVSRGVIGRAYEYYFGGVGEDAIDIELELLGEGHLCYSHVIDIGRYLVHAVGGGADDHVILPRFAENAVY